MFGSGLRPPSNSHEAGSRYVGLSSPVFPVSWWRAGRRGPPRIGPISRSKSSPSRRRWRPTAGPCRSTSPPGATGSGPWWRPPSARLRPRPRGRALSPPPATGSTRSCGSWCRRSTARSGRDLRRSARSWSFSRARRSRPRTPCPSGQAQRVGGPRRPGGAPGRRRGADRRHGDVQERRRAGRPGQDLRRPGGGHGTFGPTPCNTLPHTVSVRVASSAGSFRVGTAEAEAFASVVEGGDVFPRADLRTIQIVQA